MTSSLRFPLLAKVLGWLILHLVLLGLAFFLFVRWQLGMGLDSLLSGSAGERLGAFGDTIVSRIVEVPRHQWDEVIQTLANEKKVTAAVFDPSNIAVFPKPLPPNVLSRVHSAMPPQPRDAGRPGPPERPPRPGGRPPPRRFEDDGAQPFPPDDEPEPLPRVDSSLFLPKSRPAFLLRAENGDGYWAGVLLHLPPGRNLPRQPVMLLIRADRLDGSGMFFEFKPWLLGGISVLLLSLACWTPFVWGITRYLHRLTAAADRIASGDFKLSLPPRGNDELGNLGRTIESMAARLEHLITGQKRFLGDAAHELCAPLARIRTGIGILEMKLAGVDPSVLSSIEADTAELAALVNEILAFSRAGNRTPARRSILLEPLVYEVLAREAADIDVEVDIPHGLTAFSDPMLLGRSIGNLIRNAAVHAGPRPNVTIHAGETADAVSITVTDNGPGVPATELAHIFEPFYRLDRSRSRDTGGSGLGLAIVRTAIESCGGEAAASLPESGGFSVTLRLPKRPAAAGADPQADDELRNPS
jgi:two-component system sensor histidine kinase CpxA